ncbi:MAG: EAL domain-containing protein [Janthinobacterium lividum]
MMTKSFTTLAQLLISPKHAHKYGFIFIIGLLELACAYLVYATGGTTYAYLHVCYIPIILSGIAFQIPGGLLAGLVAGFMIGPYMPANVLLDIPQISVSWITRCGFFCLIGLFSGAISIIFQLYLKSIHVHITTDLVTNLPNTTGLKLLWQERFSKNDAASTVLIIVLNRLRDIDKAFGFEATSSLLQEITLRLRTIIPSHVYLAYVDYGTFAVLIPSGAISVQEMREKCRLSLGNRFLIDQIPIFLESHFGDATSQSNQEDLFSVIRKAKIAVDKSIELSHQDASFNVNDDGQIQRGLRLIHDLSEAIEQDQLKLVYQPKVNLKSGLCEGVEALVRWVHPQLGMISPGEFIPILEKTLLVNQFTKWLLETSLGHLNLWNRQGFSLKCAVNFSMKNFEDPSLFSELRHLLKTYNIPTGHFEIEVTETAIPANLDRVADILQSCREEGIKISVDDFGTGQSSMKYLFKLPLDCIKIDQVFIRSMMNNSAAEAIVRSAIILGHELNLQVVAEGIEIEEEYEKLKSLGCDCGQGFYFACPMPFEMATSWIQANQLKCASLKTS